MKSICGDGAWTQAICCRRLVERAGKVAWADNRTYVQNPPQLEFSAAELVWSKVEGWRDNIDRVALIPFARVDDFVRGESSSKDCPTRFHVEARRKRPPESAYKPKVDGILEYILYWCSFGPDDHRKGGVTRPSRSNYTPKKNNAGRPNSKRGCTCHFIVKRLIAKPTVALIIYNQDKHVDKKGMPCHGPQDKKAAGTHAMFAPTISEELRLRVLSLLYVGVSVETIMQRHNESVEKQGGPFNRDDLLTHRFVRRQERSIRRASFELDADDFVSVGMWVESHQSSVFFYKEFSDASPFILGIQTEWQLQQMIRFGNRGLLALNSRFGTHKLKYPVQSLLVFNTENKAIAVAWILAPTCSNHDTDRWMRALYNRVRTKDPSWKLAGFIVDDPSGDFLSIRDIFQCSLLLCFWRVRHAWHKNLVKRCPEVEMCSELSRWLGNVVDNIRRGKATANLFDGFMHDFVEARDFMDYFKAVWIPRIGAWTAALKNFPLASQETSAAMEFYQKQLKLRLLNESNTSVYKRADWLVDKLGTEVHAYFWLDEYSEKGDFARYQKDEWASGFTAWRRALKIPDSGVIVDGKCVKVSSPMNQDKIHIVWNPGSEFAICDCDWAEKGYLCEHVLKVIKYYREKGLASPSIGLNQFRQALNGILRCHPHDSLIRDHATSLSALLKKQLTELIVAESEDAIPKSVGLSNAEDINIMSLKMSCSLKNLASSDGHGCKESSGEREVNLDGHGGLISKEQCNKMDVDSPSVCISKSFLDNGAPSKDINCKNGQEVVDSAIICPASGEMNVKDTTTKDMSFQNADRNLGSNITDLSNGPALPGDAVAA